MASHPPAHCCTVGVRHQGDSTGSMLKVGKHDAYLASPSADGAHKGTGILYVPDIFGIWDNSKLLADEFATKGYPTLVIDIYNGDAIKANEVSEVDTQDWLKNGRNGAGAHTSNEIDPIVKEAIEYMKNEMGVSRIGAVGYCLGAKYVVRHYHSGIDVGFIAHPTFVEEAELAAITGPLSIAAAETDSVFPKQKRYESEEILKKTGVLYQINLYSGVSHGFAARCDLDKKQERFGKEQAFFQAVAFFDDWLL